MGFFEAGRSHDNGGLGNPWLYFDAATGQPLGAGTGTAGDLFLQAMFPLHSGRVLISLMGLVIATFSLTGVRLGLRRGAARTLRRACPQRP